MPHPPFPRRFRRRFRHFRRFCRHNLSFVVVVVAVAVRRSSPVRLSFFVVFLVVVDTFSLWSNIYPESSLEKLLSLLLVASLT